MPETSANSCQAGTIRDTVAAPTIRCRFGRRFRRLGIVGLAGLLAAAATLADSPTPGSTSLPAARLATAEGTTEPWRSLIGVGGRPLPFASSEEIERFLSDAVVRSIEGIPVGVTRPQKVLLELDGIRADAAFRTVDVFKRQERLSDGTVIYNFRDSFLGEVAAYRLDRLLGLGAVPPTVQRRIRGRRGSLQLWIESAMTQRQRVTRGVLPPERLTYQRQLRSMALFDNLICNLDRNQGNSLIDPDWKVWFIDHTRSFYRIKRLHAPQRVVWVERSIWARLQAITDGEIRAAMRGVLDKPEVNALLERRRRLIGLIDARIAALGESEVLFEYGDPPPAQSSARLSMPMRESVRHSRQRKEER